MPESRSPARLLPLLPAVPLLAAVVGLVGDRWFPVSDLAQAEVRMRSFWEHPPLIGAAGRIGPLLQQGAHPGPAAWWFMEPVYRLLGRSSWAFLAATATLSALWAGIAVSVARRRGGPLLGLGMLVVVLVLMRTWGAEVWVEPWNPWLGVTAFVALVPVVWAAIGGARWGVTATAAIGWFCLQAHAGYLPIVGALGLLAVVGSVWVRRRSDRRALVIDLGAAVVVTLLMWLPPLIEQWSNDPGNLRILWRHFSDPAEDPIGLLNGLRVVAASFNVRGLWLLDDGAAPLARTVWPGALAYLLLWGAAVEVARRRRNQEALRLHLVVAVGAAVAVVAASRVFGTVFDYLTPWIPVLAAMGALATLWSLAPAVWEALSARLDDRAVMLARAGVVTAMVVTAALFATVTVSFATTPTPQAHQSAVMARLSEQVRAELPQGPRYLVRWSDAVSLGAFGFGMVLELQREGYDVAALPVFRTTLLPHNVADPADVDRAIAVITGPQTEDWAALPGAEVIARVDDRTEEERTEAERLTEEVVRRLEAIDPELARVMPTNYWAAIIDPRTPPDLMDELERLRDIGLPVTVLALPAGAEPTLE